MAYTVASGILSPEDEAAIQKKYGASASSSSSSAPRSFAADRKWTVANFQWSEFGDGVGDARLKNGALHTLPLKSGDTIKAKSIDAYWQNVRLAQAAMDSEREAGRELSAFQVFAGDDVRGFGVLPPALRTKATDLAFAMTALNEKGLRAEFLMGDEFYSPIFYKDDPAPPSPPLARNVSFSFCWKASGWFDLINGAAGDSVVARYRPFFHHQKAKYEKALAAFQRANLRPDGFLLFGWKFTKSEPTEILAATGGDKDFWPAVSQYGGDRANGGYRRIARGGFEGHRGFAADVTAEELAYFACRLAARGEWFNFVPATWDKFTDDEFLAVAWAHLDMAKTWIEEADVEGPVVFPENRII